MKTFASLITLGVFLLGISCKRQPGPPVPEIKNPAGTQAPATPAVSPAVEKAVREKGEAVAAQAFGVLSSRLGQAIAEAGFTNAIELCSVHGITFTTAVGVTNQVDLRRVSHRPRNLQNRADTNEREFIRQFEAELSQGKEPRAVVTANAPDKVTYYAPIVLKLPLCLSCHGQPGTEIKPDVLAQIDKAYPKDEARGFKLGQVRGLWRVDFKQSEMPRD